MNNLADIKNVLINSPIGTVLKITYVHSGTEGIHEGKIISKDMDGRGNPTRVTLDGGNHIDLKSIDSDHYYYLSFDFRKILNIDRI